MNNLFTIIRKVTMVLTSKTIVIQNNEDSVVVEASGLNKTEVKKVASTFFKEAYNLS